MISETNRKRRRVERDRRAIERPQPCMCLTLILFYYALIPVISVRCIPSLPRDLPPAPSLRKIIKSSYPFETSSATPNTTVPQRPSKRRPPRYRHSHAYVTHGHQRLIYPELPTLSSIDVANDLDFLFQARLDRENGSGIGPRYDMHLHPQHQHHRHGVGVLHHMRIPPPIMAQSHPRYGVEFKEGFGMVGDPTSFINRGQPAPFSQQQQPHPPPQHLILSQTQQHQPPPLQAGVGPGGSLMAPVTTTPFVGPPAPRPQMHMQQQAAQHTAYAQRHEHHTIPHHHHQQHHPVPSSFSHEQEAIGLNGPAHHPYFSSSEGPHLQAPGGRRSISPPPTVGGMMDGTLNGTWTMPPKGLVWDDERDEAARRRGRDQPDRNLEREQRERERENQEMERDRQKEMNVHHMHHTQHRHPPPPHHRLHSAGGQQLVHHHANGPHHHHHRHHVHVLHHHHQAQSQPGTPSGGSSLPSSGAPRSPGGTYRDSETTVRSHPSQNQHPTEIINLTSTKTSPPSQSWKNDGQQRQHSPPPERRDMKNKHGRSQPPSAEFIIAEERETRPPTIPFALSPSHVLTSSSMSSSMLQHLYPRNSPPTSSQHVGPQPSSKGPLWNDNNAHMPGVSVSASGSLPPPAYASSSEGGAHMHLPSHQYAVGASNDSTLHEPPLPPPPPQSSGPTSQHPSRQTSLGLHSPPRPTGLNNTTRMPLGPRPVTPTQAESSSTAYRNLSPTRSPSRIAPPPPSLSMMSQNSQHPPMAPGVGPAHPSRSPSTSLKAMRPQSPPSSMVNKHLSGPLPHSATTPLSTGTYSPPRLSRLGRTSTPTGSTGTDGPTTKPSGSGSTNNLSGRTSSPLATFSSSHPHANINGSAFGSGPRLPLTTSTSGVNGGNSTTPSGHDRHWERDRESERDWSDREKRERDCHVSSPHLGPPPPKISVPQMVDRH